MGHDRYLTATDEGTLEADRHDPGPRETFTVKRLKGDKYALRTNYDKYVVDENFRFNADGHKIDHSAEMTFYYNDKKGEGGTAILGGQGNYLSARADHELEIRESVETENEIFFFNKLSAEVGSLKNGDHIALRTRQGRYITASENGSLKALGTHKIIQWQIFTIFMCGDGKFNMLSDHGKYVSDFHGFDNRSHGRRGKRSGFNARYEEKSPLVFEVQATERNDEGSIFICGEKGEYLSVDDNHVVRASETRGENEHFTYIHKTPSSFWM